jgi:dienelactone hydrolase
MKRDYPLLTSTRIKAAVASAGLVFAFLFSGCSSTAKRTVSYPLAEGDFKVDLTICKPEEKSEKSLLLLPPTGGTNSIDRSYAKRFCNEGFNVYLINDWSRTGETGDDLGFHQRAYTNSQHAISLVLDQVDTPYVGMIGTSVGATHASVAANVFDKINAVFFIVGGVPLMEVVATSRFQKGS